jgi:hypothetical protein
MADELVDSHNGEEKRQKTGGSKEIAVLRICAWGRLISRENKMLVNIHCGIYCSSLW